MTLIPLILCGESIARTPEAWKRFLDPDSGKVVGVLKRKSNISDFYEKTVDSWVFLGGESIARTPEPWKRFLDPDSEKEWCIEAKIKISDFYEKTVDF